MHPKLILTSDGSHSLRVDELDEHYHSIHGAIQESKHVFIEAGLKYFKEKDNLAVFEVGLGTGLNVLLSVLESMNSPQKIHYTSIEAFPLDWNIVSQLNYVNELKNEELKNVFDIIHRSDWNTPQKLTPNFTFVKKQIKLQDIALSTEIDIIYFDAFGPRVQPEMWTAEVFLKLYSSLNANGILVTYCAKGEVKRTLKSCGFYVETLPGPPGKREMIRAIKK